MAVPLSRDFEQPKMEKYDGSSDRVDHLRAFVDLMRLRLNYVQDFPADTQASKREKKTTIGLMQLTQDKDELLKDFIARFNRAILGIKDLQMLAIVTAMMNRTHSHPFKMSLSKNPPDTMHELLRRGDKYVDAEETFFITKGMKVRKEPESNKRKARDEPRPREDRGKQKMIHPDLNRPSTGKEFVKVDKEKGKEAEYRQQPPPRTGVINVIVGGITAGGDSNSAWKSYARGNRSTLVDKNERFNQNITFNDEDLEDVTCPHDDALIIVADIVDFDVKRVLADNGSAANVMSWKVFLGLKISPS
ncbi:Uncharacterized protein Adt_14450 [Abeliophyllum distichum]|uniref:Retrotransposon gag domain-containing protein n=1 Tax=Abeliophyllum distichum TaxID=126358 RepID=A0ABD1TZN8_9LAMI